MYLKRNRCRDIKKASSQTPFFENKRKTKFNLSSTRYIK